MNILENIPYREEGMGMRKVVDEKHLQVIQIALKPGQNVPRHEANSNVHLLVLKGKLSVNLGGLENEVLEGGLLPVIFKTPMLIKNTGSENAFFLVIKTPNPSEMR
ncbi:MAG TPA: hypothetical protein PKN36_01115 [bacterium]|nr:hypothetical protein [bacterium]